MACQAIWEQIHEHVSLTCILVVENISRTWGQTPGEAFRTNTLGSRRFDAKRQYFVWAKALDGMWPVGHAPPAWNNVRTWSNIWSKTCTRTDLVRDQDLGQILDQNHGNLSEICPYGSKLFHVDTRRSHMPQDHFSTPFDHAANDGRLENGTSIFQTHEKWKACTVGHGLFKCFPLEHNSEQTKTNPGSGTLPESGTRFWDQTQEQNLVSELGNRSSATGVHDSGVPKYGAGIWY